MPLRLDACFAELERCDLFVAIGTSAAVYPAASFVDAAGGAHTIEVNPNASERGFAFREHRRGRAGIEVPRLVDELLE